MAVRNYSSVSPITTLVGAIAPGDTSLTVASSASSFPAVPFTLILAPDTVNEEIVDVTATSGSAFTVTRGVDGTTAKSHAAGTSAIHGVSARDFREANDFINNPPSGVKFQATEPASPQDGEVWIDSDSTVEVLDPTSFLTSALLTTKGDLIARTSSAPVRLGAGTDGQGLLADSTQATGLRWANVALLSDIAGAVFGSGITNVVALTRAAYDALTPSPTTLYVITD
jgi:hypothetical protein